MKQNLPNEPKAIGPAPDQILKFDLRGNMALVSLIDTWIAARPDPKPTRSDAIFQLVSLALEYGLAPAPSVAQKIARAERKMAGIDVPEKPSVEKGMAMLRRGKAEAGLAALKAKSRKSK